MKRGREIILFSIFFILFIISLSGFIFADSDGTMTVEVNLVGFANASANISDVSIWVPDYISLGNVTADNPVSEEVKVYVNNTGKVNITVTPQLKNLDDEILKYLQFRKRTTGSGPAEDKIFYNIGEFNLDVPYKGMYRHQWCYMSLNLTDYDGIIEDNNYNYQSEITFLAMKD